MTIALITINQPSLDAAVRLLPYLAEHTVDLFGKSGLKNAPDTLHTFTKLDTILPDAWERYDVLIFLLATGAVVRKIAPLLRNKATDPAVLVINLTLDRIIPLLGGHLGGANALAETLTARLPGCINFLSTATDQTGTLAFEMLAQERGWSIDNLHALARISNRLIDHQPVKVATWPSLFASIPDRRNLVRVDLDAIDEDTVVIAPHIPSSALTLKPPVTLGIGCNRGTPAEAFEEALNTFLETHNLQPEQIDRLASFEAKRDETGLLAFAEKHGWEITFFDAEAINRLPGTFSPSAAERFFGLKGVAEPSAVLGSAYRELLFPKTVYNGHITIAGAI